MSRRTPSNQTVTTVDLPSGRTLEVVYPPSGEPYTRVKFADAASDRDLAICERCSCALVEPTDWRGIGSGRWRVALRCPDCQHRSEGVFSQECVDRFDESLDDANAQIVRDLRRLEHANMTDAVERFIAALAADAILPEDFAWEGGVR